MDDERWNGYLSQVDEINTSINPQINEIMKAEFSERENRINNSFNQQKFSSEYSPAFGSRHTQDKAMDASEKTYHNNISALYIEMKNRKDELENAKNNIIDKLFEFDGGSYDEAKKLRDNWLEEQAKNRTKENNPNMDSKLEALEDKSDQATNTIATEFNEPRPSVNEKFNDKAEGFDLDL